MNCAKNGVYYSMPERLRQKANSKNGEGLFPEWIRHRMEPIESESSDADAFPMRATGSVTLSKDSMEPCHRPGELPPAFRQH